MAIIRFFGSTEPAHPLPSTLIDERIKPKDITGWIRLNEEINKKLMSTFSLIDKGHDKLLSSFATLYQLLEISQSKRGLTKEIVNAVEAIVAGVRKYKITVLTHHAHSTLDRPLIQLAYIAALAKESTIDQSQLKSKLQPGGYLYCSVKEVKPEGKEEEILIEHDYGYEYSRFFSYFTMSEMIDCVKKIGMEIMYEDIVRSGKTNWIQIIAR